MALNQRIEVRQSQSLVMTPQLQQAIKLLQLSGLDLVAYVDQEIERNPLLERDDGAGVAEAPVEPAVSLLSTDRALAPENASFDGEASLPDGLGAVFDTTPGDAAQEGASGEVGAASWAASARGGGGFGEGDAGVEGAASRPTLKDHLREQLCRVGAGAGLGDGDRLIAEMLIDAVDANGWMVEPIAAMADRLGSTHDRIEAVLAVLQTFDPVGVMARGLGECLALQCRDRDRLDPAMATFLAHLDLVAAHDFTRLAGLCGVDVADVRDMVNEVRSLNPRPGLAFDHEPVEAVVPDVLVTRAGGEWLLELNPDTLPRLLVDQRYHTRMVRGARTRDEKAWVAERLGTANWLIKALDQRARTILKVATELVRHQEAFLEHGIACLRPLNLRTIADAIGMHESTVSRVTANKYLATPRGIFEMKYFFTSAIASASGGDAHSAEAVRHRIRALIDAETAGSILSDDRIVELLRADGVDIARRTVAKYREAMRIPSSVERRRRKVAEAAG